MVEITTPASIYARMLMQSVTSPGTGIRRRGSVILLSVGNGCLPRASGVEQDAQHAAQRLGSAPQELVADGEGAQVPRAHGKRAQPAHGDGERAGDCHRREVAHRRLAVV